MWNGCKGISIGYFSQPVEELLKKVFVGYVEGERVEPRYGRDSVRDWEGFVELGLTIKEGSCVSLKSSGMNLVHWFQVWPDGCINMTIAKDQEEVE